MMLVCLLVLLVTGLSSAERYPCSTCNCTAAEFLSVSNHLIYPILNYDVSTTSLSPWTYKCTKDMDRIPMVLCNAVCDQPCWKFSKAAKPAGIKVRISTFRRHPCDNGRYRLSRTQYKLIVGCTCVK